MLLTVLEAVGALASTTRMACFADNPARLNATFKLHPCHVGNPSPISGTGCTSLNETKKDRPHTSRACPTRAHGTRPDPARLPSLRPRRRCTHSTVHQQSPHWALRVHISADVDDAGSHQRQINLNFISRAPTVKKSSKLALSAARDPRRGRLLLELSLDQLARGVARCLVSLARAWQRT